MAGPLEEITTPSATTSSGTKSKTIASNVKKRSVIRFISLQAIDRITHFKASNNTRILSIELQK